MPCLPFPKANRTTDSQGLRVIHSAIPAITVFLDANL